MGLRSERRLKQMKRRKDLQEAKTITENGKYPFTKDLVQDVCLNCINNFKHENNECVCLKKARVNFFPHEEHKKDDMNKLNVFVNQKKCTEFALFLIMM